MRPLPNARLAGRSVAVPPSVSPAHRSRRACRYREQLDALARRLLAAVVRCDAGLSAAESYLCELRSSSSMTGWITG